MEFNYFDLGLAVFVGAFIGALAVALVSMCSDGLDD